MDGYIIIAVLVAICIFFACRELNCWYLKINKRLEIMNEMVENQKDMIALLRKLNGMVPDPEEDDDEPIRKPKEAPVQQKQMSSTEARAYAGPKC